MSNTQFVFVAEDRVPSTAQLQGFIDALGFDLKLYPSHQTRVDSGFLPCTLHGEEGPGFEIYYQTTAELAEDNHGLAAFARGRSAAMVMVWRSSEKDLACVLIVSCALVKYAYAVVSHEGGEPPSTFDELHWATRQIVASALREAPPRRRPPPRREAPSHAPPPRKQSKEQERRRQLKAQGKTELERRSQEVRAALSEANPARPGDPDWSRNYRRSTERERWLRHHLPLLHAAELEQLFVVRPYGGNTWSPHIGGYVLCSQCGSAAPSALPRRTFYWAACQCGNIWWLSLFGWQRCRVRNPDLLSPISLIGRGAT